MLIEKKKIKKSYYKNINIYYYFELEVNKPLKTQKKNHNCKTITSAKQLFHRMIVLINLY